MRTEEWKTTGKKGNQSKIHIQLFFVEIYLTRSYKCIRDHFVINIILGYDDGTRFNVAANDWMTIKCTTTEIVEQEKKKIRTKQFFCVWRKLRVCYTFEISTFAAFHSRQEKIFLELTNLFSFDKKKTVAVFYSSFLQQYISFARFFFQIKFRTGKQLANFHTFWLMDSHFCFNHRKLNTVWRN